MCPSPIHSFRTYRFSGDVWFWVIRMMVERKMASTEATIASTTKGGSK